LDALDRGVNVFLLLEGNPIGGINAEELYIAAKIRARGGEVRFAIDPFINHAKYVVIDSETTMIMTENWKKTGIPYNNTLRRGCEVKVLLDSKYLAGYNNNDEVISWLRQVAAVEHLDLEAELADLNGLGLVKIHNKGLIVDDRKVIITSLNWNANSIHNREAGVIIENAEIASFFNAVFFHDWNVSVKAGGEEGNMKIVWVILTLLISFAIFRVVKWYKRI
jgi:phosphatidylserine/phosphatidylglycerophosphate/cardiolipin synthase-like enzyme